jgi:hypothetical protein
MGVLQINDDEGRVRLHVTAGYSARRLLAICSGSSGT